MCSHWVHIQNLFYRLHLLRWVSWIIKNYFQTTNISLITLLARLQVKCASSSWHWPETCICCQLYWFHFSSLLHLLHIAANDTCKKMQRQKGRSSLLFAGYLCTAEEYWSGWTKESVSVGISIDFTLIHLFGRYFHGLTERTSVSQHTHEQTPRHTALNPLLERHRLSPAGRKKKKQVQY